MTTRMTPTSHDSPTLAQTLEARLREVVRGEVDFSSKAQGLYASDASNYRHVPMGVVLPFDSDDVVETVIACTEAGVPVTIRGGGTSIAGNASGTGVVIDTSRHLNRVLSIDPIARTAVVESGVVLDQLNAAAAEYNLRFAPDPSTHSRCTIGGMLGNDACGSHSVAWGRTMDNVLSMEVLLPDGTLMSVGPTTPEELAELCKRTDRTGKIYQDLRALVQNNLAILRTGFVQMPRRVSGYALDALLPERGFNLARALVGSEGTCVTVLSATLSLAPVPASLALVVVGFVDDVAAADAVPLILPNRPLTVEGMNRELVAQYIANKPDGAEVASQLPTGAAWLFLEVGGDDELEASSRSAKIAADLQGVAGFTSSVVVNDVDEQKALWRIREEGAGLAARMPDGTEAFPGWEDAAVPPANLGAYLRDFRVLLAKHNLRGATYGHFGDGCIHTRIDFDFLTSIGVSAFRTFVEEAADLVLAHGGSLSGEHGDGQARGELLIRMYSPEVISLFESFKAVWDPTDVMNPGMLVRPRPLDVDLRVSPNSAREVTDVVFAYPHDGGDFAAALRRCVGVGKCRSHEGGLMCPSYRATGDEENSTRGRAHLLQEMLDGNVIKNGWRSVEVREALDLCLSCKACSSDCPTNVDMATYKAEFLHHHYKRRLRPAAHYSMGWLPWWARIASKAPRLINAVTSSPLAPVLRRVGGIDANRKIPRFADRTFISWMNGRAKVVVNAPRVVLWPDTFTNYFSPQVGRAAVRVFESAGIVVDLPSGDVCCGLTWISTGQLDIARSVLRKTLRTIAPLVGTDTLVVGLEPSCAAALRKDLPELLPNDPAAIWLSTHVVTFAEALEKLAPANWAPQIPIRTIRQTHCHQYAAIGSDADRRIMARLGIDNKTLPSSCCGLAGNFGFEKGHYDISMAIGEAVLLPAVREADANTTVLADGFSCRTQIDQATDRRALHLAELIDQLLP